MDNKPTLSVPVRSLIEVVRSGDLSLGFQAGVRAQDGIRFHQAIQKANAEKYPGYTPEVPLEYALEEEDLVLEIGGRVDGIAVERSGVTVEEIKTTAEDMDVLAEESHPLHWAQAKCYAFMYASLNKLPAIAVRLTYFQVDTKETKRFTKTFTLTELEVFFTDLTDRYLSWARTLRDWGAERDRSLRALEFPFDGYRAGQRAFAAAVYRTVRDGKKLFARAPTGTGKTIAALFPAVKSLGEGLATKIFYLTAKTVTREIAEKAFDIMRGKGARIKTVTLTAKEKTCFSPGAACTPDECPYAKGYYDRLGAAVRDIFARDAFTREAIETCAKLHAICPFEFSLELSLWADAVICDYNYAFDPRVYLRRFFDEEEAVPGGSYVFLVDEAHNLVDRSREMFSAVLRGGDFGRLGRSLKTGRKKKQANMIRDLKETAAALEEYLAGAVEPDVPDENAESRGGFTVRKEAPEEVYPLLKDFTRASEKCLAGKEEYPFREELLERYFDALRFLRTADAYDERYVTYFTRSEESADVKLFCMDPAHLLSEALTRASASVFFSATLQPMDYYMRVLGGDADDGHIMLPSPFPKENLRVIVDGTVPTNYRMRPFTYDRVAEDVSALVKARTGNYLVYFPSYRYLREIHRRFTVANPDVEVIAQRETMSERERSAFLEAFCEGRERTLAGFAVMGGVFGEGIDLVGERLSGVAVVGVGLPQISLERDLLRQYYQETLGQGFEYAYVFPGMNKVQQAVGRLIRTETDCGVALLIDERFAWPSYRDLMPPEWLPATGARGPEGIRGAASLFWEGRPRGAVR